MEIEDLATTDEALSLYPHPNLRLRQSSSSSSTYSLRVLHRDAQGSVRATTGGNGGLEERFLYRPYGTQISNSPTGTLAARQSKGWIGERYDADAGLQYLNARYYDPDLAPPRENSPPDCFLILVDHPAGLVGGH